MDNPYPSSSTTRQLPRLGSHQPPEPPKKHGSGIGRVAVPLVAAIVGGAVALGGAAATGNLSGGDTTVVQEARNEPAVQISPPAQVDPERSAAEAEAAATDEPPKGGGALSVQEIVRRTSPAVVEVTVGGDILERRGRVINQQALGSGFVIDTAGHIVTNQHVVEGARTAAISFENGTVVEAEVLGTDPSADVAVLKIDALPDGVQPVDFGSSASLQVGDPVVALGNPLGQNRTATTGVVSALERIIEAPDGETAIQNAIRTDAAINQGNSGGPLFDRVGKVIGINSQIATRGGGSDGIGFAVPSDTVRPIVNAIISTGAATHAWVGIEGSPINAALAKAMGIPGQQGVVIGRIFDGSPAKSAGLRGATNYSEAFPGPGEERDLGVPEGADIIVEIDGVAITDMADVSRAVSSSSVGDEISIVILRDGVRQELTFNLGDRPSSASLNRP